MIQCVLGSAARPIFRLVRPSRTRQAKRERVCPRWTLAMSRVEPRFATGPHGENLRESATARLISPPINGASVCSCVRSSDSGLPRRCTAPTVLCDAMYAMPCGRTALHFDAPCPCPSTLQHPPPRPPRRTGSRTCHSKLGSQIIMCYPVSNDYQLKPSNPLWLAPSPDDPHPINPAHFDGIGHSKKSSWRLLHCPG